MRVLICSALVLGGCGTDLFALPWDQRDLGIIVVGDLSGDAGTGGDDGGDDLSGGGGDLAGSDFTQAALPASCAQLGCTPAMNEGDVDLDSGDVSGCHAYNRLSIGGVVTVGKSDGQGFAACANTIVITISLSADGRGFAGGNGPGAGGSCGSGGGHGGKGADATGCSGGGTYDDPNLPRMPGSGGGSFGGGGGAGGGAIEFAADDVQILGFISAGGAPGGGAVAGGGAGGSVLIHAGQLIGSGSVRSQGGGGLGLGGGGGGGRIAVYATTNLSQISYDVSGGDSMSGSAGAPGTLIQP